MEVIINGTAHNVGTAAVSRSVRREYKYKVTTEDGKVHKEIRASYVDFSLKLGNVDTAAYDNLMRVLLSSVEDVEVTLPTGQGTADTYTGEFKTIADSLLLENEDGAYYDNLTLAFEGTVPVEVGA